MLRKQELVNKFNDYDLQRNIYNSL